MKTSIQNQLLFVYGTLMRNGRAEDYLSGSEFIGKAILKDYAMYKINHGDFPGIVSKKGEWVEGELYLIRDTDCVGLDRYEGEGTLYHREIVTVESSTGQKQAWAYIYLGKPEGKPMREPWINNDEDVIWYAVYGSNLCKKRFMYYVEGGDCEANGRHYDGCRMKYLVSDEEFRAWFPGQMYFGNTSGTWNDKGVAFYDPSASGRTFMRMYKVTREQLWDIQGQESRKPEWYGRIMALGIHADGCPIYTLTSEFRHSFNAPDISYLSLISQALVEENGFTKEEAEAYLDECLDKTKRSTVILKDKGRKKEELTYEQWLKWHAEDLKWIVKMAYNGIHVTPDAGNHPANLVLYMLACDVDKALQKKDKSD